MKKHIAAVATIAASVLAIGLPAQAQVTYTPEAQESYLSGLAEFLSQFGFGDYMSTMSSDQALDMGYTVCRTLNTGSSVADVQRSIAAMAVRDYPAGSRRDAVTTLGSAATYNATKSLCPQHWWQTEQIIQQYRN